MSDGRIFLANVDPELFPPRAVALLEADGWQCAGNFYSRSPSVSAFRPDLIIYVPTRRADALGATELSKVETAQVVPWVLYPDQVAGWEVARNTFGAELVEGSAGLLRQHSFVLANSRFTKRLLESIAPWLDVAVCPLGIDIQRILAATGGRVQRHCAASVLWQHRWSADKNLTQLFEDVVSLAKRHKHISFYVGRAYDWQPCYVPASLRVQAAKFAEAAAGMRNIRLVPRFPSQVEFWQFLQHVDIGFSTAYHETFGLAMLEQAAAGIACVVPDHGSYPEIHQGAYCAPLDQVGTAVEALLEDPRLWMRVAASSQCNAMLYDVGHSSRCLSSFIKGFLEASHT